MNADFLVKVSAQRQKDEQLRVALLEVRPQVRTFVDATSAAVSKYLPPIADADNRDFYFVKIDSSVNAVTIYPAGTDTIEGASSFALAAQYDGALLIPHTGVWYVLP